MCLLHADLWYTKLTQQVTRQLFNPDSFTRCGRNSVEVRNFPNRNSCSQQCLNGTLNRDRLSIELGLKPEYLVGP